MANEKKSKKNKEGFWQKLLRNKSKYSFKCLYKGAVKMARGEFHAAKNYFNESVKCNGDKNAYLKLANLALYENNEKLALDYLYSLVENNKAYFDIVLTVARFYSLNNKHDKAIEILTRLSQICPKNSEICLNLLKCKAAKTDFEDLKQLGELIDEYAKVKEIFKNNSRFNYELAMCYAKIGDINNAITYCKKALEKLPNEFEVNKMLGLFLLIKKDFDESKKYLNKALKLNNKDVEIHELISYLVCSGSSPENWRACRSQYFEVIQETLKIM